MEPSNAIWVTANAERIARLIEESIAAHVARHVHQATNDKPLEELHAKLVTALVCIIR